MSKNKGTLAICLIEIVDFYLFKQLGLVMGSSSNTTNETKKRNYDEAVPLNVRYFSNHFMKGPSC